MRLYNFSISMSFIKFFYKSSGFFLVDVYGPSKKNLSELKKKIKKSGCIKFFKVKNIIRFFKKSILFSLLNGFFIFCFFFDIISASIYLDFFYKESISFSVLLIFFFNRFFSLNYFNFLFSYLYSYIFKNQDISLNFIFFYMVFNKIKMFNFVKMLLLFHRNFKLFFLLFKFKYPLLSLTDANN